MSDDKGPMTALAAVEAAASSAATPEPASTDAATPAAATAPSASATPDPAVNPSTDEGPIPLERHKKILDGVYTERDGYKQQLDEWKAYEWAKAVPREQFESMAGWYQKAQTNPVEFALALVDELSASPAHAAAMRTHAGRLLRAGRGATPEPQAPDLTPDIPVFDQQGQQVAQTFSADRVKAIVEHAVAQAIATHVDPLKQDAQQRQQAQQQAETQRQTHEFVAKESARIRTAVQKLPKATEHWQAITDKARTYSEDIPIGEALRDAYFEVVYPLLTHAAKSDVLDTLKQKAAAKTEDGTHAATTPMARPTNRRELEATIAHLAGNR